MIDYKAGQIWTYDAREGEEESRLFIVKVDPHEILGSIYHIYLDHLCLRNPYVDGGVQTELCHSPLSAEALDASGMRLIVEDCDELPDISEGYQIWKEAFEKGDAGIFTISVKEIVGCLENAVKS